MLRELAGLGKVRDHQYKTLSAPSALESSHSHFRHYLQEKTAVRAEQLQLPP